MIFETRYEPAQDYNMSLWEIVDSVKRKIWIAPDHQRGTDVWAKTKKAGWVKRLASPVLPVGVIVTYQVADGKPSQIFINDGMQRINTTIEFLQDSKSYNYNPAEAEDIVRKCRMPIQHRHYQSHDEAYLDFQRLNQGTALTGLEFYKGALSYMDNYKTLWEPLFVNLHQTIAQCSARVVGSRASKTRSQVHKTYRHDYVLAYRFLAKDKTMQRFQVGKEDMTSDRLERRDVIEWHLRISLEQVGNEIAHQEFDKLLATIERETALVETLWAKVKQDEAIRRGLSLVLYRFIMEAAIWKRNNGVSNEIWTDFVKRLLVHTGGVGSVINPADPVEKYGLALGRLGILKRACEFVESDMVDFSEMSRKTRNENLKPGYDQSHLFPFSTNGNGPTIPEPASINRSRRAKPIELETSGTID